MSTVQDVGISPISINEKIKNENAVNFRALGQRKETNDSYDSFIKEQEQARKKSKIKNSIMTSLQVGSLVGIIALAVVSIASMSGRFNPAGFKKSHLEFKKYTNDDTLGDLLTTKTLQEDVRTMLVDMVNSKKIKPEFLELAGGSKQGSPNAAILLGKSGVGKTESVKMKSKADGSWLGIIKMTSFGNSYLNGNAISMSEMFKTLEKMFTENPQQRYTILFDEGDALARAFKNVDAHNNYLDKDRQAFITGVEGILKHNNVDVFLATNVPLEEIDEAVITRFGRNIYYNLPNAEQFFEALKFHLRNIKGCTYNGLNYFEDKKNEIMNFIRSMVDKKCAYRDLKNITTQAVDNYKKDMVAQDKKLQFSTKYLEDALQTMGKSAGEITENKESKSNLLEILLQSSK